MFEYTFGPYYHPESRHLDPYYVGFIEDVDKYCTVMKRGGNGSEYQVDLTEKVAGRICQCPHHTNRKVPCHHMKFARAARARVLRERAPWFRI